MASSARSDRKLKHLRQEQRLSLQQLAARAEVSAAAIHKIERNDMVPTITTLLKIATALERPVSYFVESDEGLRRNPSPSLRPSERPAVFTPHAGLTLAGVSGPYAPFRSAAAVATVEAGANSGTSRSSTPARNWSSSWRGADVRHRRDATQARARRRAAFHR